MIDIKRSFKSIEETAIESLETGKYIRLHLRFSGQKEFCIKYEQQPYLQQLPPKARILTQTERNQIVPVTTENYILSIALEAGNTTVDLTELKSGVHPITLYYINSTTEKFNTECPYSILSFNCPHTTLSAKREDLTLSISLKSDTVSYKGNIPVSFKVTLSF